MDQQIASGKQVGEQGANKPRGRWAKGESGNPHGNTAKKRAEELFVAMVGDFPKPSGVERTMLLQAARMLVRAERTKDGDVAVRAAALAHRLLTSLRSARHRQDAPREPLRERIMAAEAEHAE
jgi:hypothetical protein